MTATQISIAKLACTAAVLALSVFWRAEALVLLVLLLFIRPVAREIKPCPDMDERQNMLFLKGGYFGFLSAMLVVLGVFVFKLLVQEKNPEPEWYLVLAVPLLVNASFYLWRASGLRKVGLVLGFLFGGFWTAFTLASHGFSLVSLVESVVGMSIVISTAIAMKWPRIGGTLLMVASLVFTFAFIGIWVRMPNPVNLVLMICLLPLPVFLAGVCLFRYGISLARPEDENNTEPRGEA